MPALAAPAPALAARAWENWPAWSYLEAGSAKLRTRLESEWGGITKLDQLQILPDVTGMNEAFMVARAALQDRIDITRPMRQVSQYENNPSGSWAIGFAAGATSSNKLPAICITEFPGPFRALETSPGPWCPPCVAIARPGDRAIVCGIGDAAQALRDDFVARGLQATTDVIHAEEHYPRNPSPSHVVLDVHDDAGARKLHATIHATPLTPLASRVSNTLFTVASRVQRSPRIAVGGPFSAFGLDLETPVRFDGFDLEGTTQAGHYYGRFDEQTLTFLEMTVDKLAAHLVPFWKKFQINGVTIRVDPMPAPIGFPAGTRRFRHREWVRNNGDISVCTPQPHQIGGCKVVGHRPPTTNLVSDVEFLLIPGDGGTWLAMGHSPEQVMAVLEILTSPPPSTSPTWTLPAVALGKQSTGKAELFWAEHVLPNGDLELEIDGSIRP